MFLQQKGTCILKLTSYHEAVTLSVGLQMILLGFSLEVFIVCIIKTPNFNLTGSLNLF